MVRQLTWTSIKWFFKGVWIILPYLFRIAVAALAIMLETTAAIVSGIPEAVGEMADDWIENASVAGYPTEYDRFLYVGAVIVATIEIFLGWILLSFLTVFLVRLLF